MTGYQRALIDKLKFCLQHYPAVAILGARQTGKTTLSKQVAPHWRYLDLENVNDLALLNYDTQLFFMQHSQDVIIDEAQCYPQLFPALRGVIDQHRMQKGRFIITGSSSPDLLKQASESLAGRIAILELGTLKINEYAKKPLSPFYQLLQQPLDKKLLPFQHQPLTNETIQHVWLNGGYPEPLISDNKNYITSWYAQYENTYLNRDIAALFPKLNKLAYQRFLRTLSSLSGTIINKSQLARDIEVSESTIKDYLSIAEGTFIWRMLPSYDNDQRRSTVKMPKGIIRDSGLLHHLLKISSFQQLYSSPMVGRSFEGFVIEEILKGLSATLDNWQAYYYRTRHGAEIDLILHGTFGILPIEIKYGVNVERRKLQTLKQFVIENNLPFGLLINQATHAEWVTPEIFQLPVGYL